MPIQRDSVGSFTVSTLPRPHHSHISCKRKSLFRYNDLGVQLFVVSGTNAIGIPSQGLIQGTLLLLPIARISRKRVPLR